MDLDFSKIFAIILKFGSLAGIGSLIFNFTEHLKKRSRFKFDFRGSTGSLRTHENLEFYDIVFDGHVKNQSKEQNSVTEIFYLIWENKARTRFLTNGGGATILDGDDRTKKITLPILFEPKEGKHLIIKFSVCLTGTHVNELVRERREIAPGSAFTLPKYDFSLAFKDVDETLFDDMGQIRSQKLADLWWTLPNTFRKLKSGNPLPYLWHMMKIFFAFIGYKISSFVKRLGF